MSTRPAITTPDPEQDVAEDIQGYLAPPCDFGDIACAAGQVEMLMRWAGQSLDRAYEAPFPSGGHDARIALRQLRVASDALPQIVAAVERLLREGR